MPIRFSPGPCCGCGGEVTTPGCPGLGTLAETLYATIDLTFVTGGCACGAGLTVPLTYIGDPPFPPPSGGPLANWQCWKGSHDAADNTCTGDFEIYLFVHKYTTCFAEGSVICFHNGLASPSTGGTSMTGSITSYTPPGLVLFSAGGVCENCAISGGTLQWLITE